MFGLMTAFSNYFLKRAIDGGFQEINLPFYGGLMGASKMRGVTTLFVHINKNIQQLIYTTYK